VADQPIVFLMYHELEQPGQPVSQSDPGYVRYVLKESDFRAQMELLKNRGRCGLSVSSALRLSDGRSVAITFDDGSETDWLLAAPILQQVGFGATFYITSSWVGEKGHLSHAQLRELCAAGFEIGCHSRTHAYLTDLDESELRREIAGAKSELEQIIGMPVDHFSCPGGRFDQRVTSIAREAGYHTVATSQIRANSKATDRFALGRIAVLRSTSLHQFEQVCSGRGLGRHNAIMQLRAAAKKLLGNSLYDRIRQALLRS
jgi:peptidoglycan/xylan/chitin deacetylase (PgdA/CDA1 family)